MKLAKMLFVSLLVISCLVQAQYMGGNGRGDISVSLANVPLPVEEVTNFFPTKYTLEHNYPNPFNPSTKIKYSIPRTSLVQIKVFDVLGHETESLVNEEKPSGTYELTWNAENLTSGVYFYQLKAGVPSTSSGQVPSTSSGQVFIQTKKMILLK